MTQQLFAENHNVPSFISHCKAILLTCMVWGKRIFTPFALIFIGIIIWNSRTNLSALLVGCSFYRIGSAIFIWILLNVFSPYFLNFVLSACGSSLSYKKAINIHISRLPAKYLPGGIWYAVARGSDLYHHNEVNPRHLATLVFLEHTLSVGVTFFVGGLILAGNSHDGIMKYIFLISAGCGLVLLLLNPILVNRFILKQTAKFTLPQYAVTTCISSLFWLVASTAFVAYFSGVMGFKSNEPFFVLAGTYMFSWGVGFIAIFAPQGIGVFEGVATFTLQLGQPFGEIATVIAGFRLIILVADLTTWAGFNLLGKVYSLTRRK